MKKICLLVLGFILAALVSCTGNNEVPTPTAGPSITILSPNGGEQWDEMGRPVSFKTIGVEKINIDLENWEGNPSGGPLTWRLETDLPASSSGKYAITAVKDLVPKVRSGTNFKVRVWATQSTGQPVEARSDNYFSIATPLERVSLIPSIISPNGGEQWEIGETHKITWNYTGFESNAPVQIGLRDGRYDPNLGQGEMTIANTTNKGFYVWTIPSIIEGRPLQAGSFFKITLYIAGGGEGKYDLSDNNFQITRSNTDTKP